MEKQEISEETPALEGPEEQNAAALELDKLDEQAIVAEIEGTTIFEDLFYVPKSGKPQMTWKGVKELRNVMREQGRPISVVRLDIEEFHDHANYKPLIKDFPCTLGCKYIAMAVAKLMNTGERSPAEGEQSILMEVHDVDQKGNKLKTTHWEIDPYPRQKAGSKAKRNAIREFIPELAITKAAERWKAKQFEATGPKVAGRSQASGSSSPASNVVANDTTQQGLQNDTTLETIESLAGDEAEEVRKAINSLRWLHKFTSNGEKRTRKWNPTDPDGYARSHDDTVEIESGRPLHYAVAGHSGKVALDQEIFSESEEEGMFYRVKKSEFRK